MRHKILQIIILNYFFVLSTYSDEINSKDSDSSSDAKTSRFFDQKLDHFNNHSNLTWRQRYFLNNQYFNGQGPVFLLIGSEQAAKIDHIVSGYWITQAKGALCLFLEHRFYGDSIPTVDVSDENLAFLNIEQALGDIAFFRRYISKKYNLTERNKWISFGGSYGGQLSALFRLLYPDLVYGAVSSSAPMYSKINFKEYYEQINTSLHRYSPKCPEQIKIASQKIEQLVNTSEGINYLYDTFKQCETINSTLDINHFLWNLAENFAYAVQFDKVLEPTISISSFCDTMINETLGDQVKRYAHTNQLFMRFKKKDCLSVSYNNLIKYIKNPFFNTSNMDRQWLYQTCNEFGNFQTSDSNFQPFGHSFPYEYYAKQCLDVFGDLYSKSVKNGNIFKSERIYGGLNYNGSRVIFVNGDNDPWHFFGITQSLPNNSTHIILIKGGVHCSDMRDETPNDSYHLKIAKKKIHSILSDWLN